MSGGAFIRLILVAGIGAGCTLQATKPPAVAMPTSFEQALPSDQATWPSRDWYRGFGSPELNGLIEQASSNNFDVSAARSRIAQADARARQAHAAILPSVDATGNANYLAGHSVNGTAHETDWAALLSASYEVDFWGKNRAAADSARLLTVAARADHDTVALTTLAGVANGYFQVLSLRERLSIAHSNVDAARTLMSIVDACFKEGLSNPVEVATQKAALASAELTVPELEQTQVEALAALALLVGRQPEGFTVEGSPIESLTEPAVTAGLPSELLQRRPHVYMAEANLKSESAELVVKYRAAIVAGLVDAENSLSAISHLDAARAFQEESLTQSERAFEGAQIRYKEGSGDFLTVVEAQRTLYAARDQFSQYRLARLQALVSLCKALGGGWQAPEGAAQPQAAGLQHF